MKNPHDLGNLVGTRREDHRLGWKGLGGESIRLVNQKAIRIGKDPVGTHDRPQFSQYGERDRVWHRRPGMGGIDLDVREDTTEFGRAATVRLRATSVTPFWCPYSESR
jgi:hypothetical protein